MPKRSLAAVLAVLALACATPAMAATDPNQQVFLVGVQATARGDYTTAIELLGPLADQTGQPRVRLEFARALYLNKQYKRARSEFLKVYYLKDLPYAVRRSINVFLTDIDQKAGFVQPTLGVAFDTNPGKAAAGGTYDLFGIPMQLDRHGGLESVGLSYGADVAAPVGRSNFSVVGKVDGAAYRISGASYVEANAAIRHSDPGLKGWSQLGAAVYSLDRNDTVYSVYIQRTRRFLFSGGRQLTLAAEISRNEVTPLREYSGFTFQLDADYAFDAGRDTALDIALEASRSTAAYAVDERWSGAARATVIRALPKLNKNLLLAVGEDVIRYDAADPFFGKVRRDRISQAELTALNGTPVHGLFPGVSLLYERDDCSIPFYGHVRKDVLFQLRRRF